MDKKPTCGCPIEHLSAYTRRVKHVEGCGVQAERIEARNAALEEMTKLPERHVAQSAQAALGQAKAR